jgi:hypothetical protein
VHLHNLSLLALLLDVLAIVPAFVSRRTMIAGASCPCKYPNSCRAVKPGTNMANGPEPRVNGGAAPAHQVSTL